MSGHARHVAPLGPAPVAVHDDGDVSWEPAWIEMPVDFRFFPIQSRGNFVLQSDPLRIEANTGGKGLAMIRRGVWPRPCGAGALARESQKPRFRRRRARTLRTNSSNFCSASRNSFPDMRSFASALSRLKDSTSLYIADEHLRAVLFIVTSFSRI